VGKSAARCVVWLAVVGLVACKSSSMPPAGGDDAGPGTDATTCENGSPTTCDDGNACTADTSTGTAEACDLVCTNTTIDTCVTDDGCCPAGCNFATDDDCPPPTSAPLQDRLTTNTVATPAGVIPGVQNWRIWGRQSLRIGPVFTVPLPTACGTLVGYTTGTIAAPTARVARLDGNDQLVTTYDLGPFTLRGLAAEPDGHFAALLWDQVPDPETLKVTRYDANGVAGWSTPLDDTLAAPTDFGIGESRLEYGNGRYGAYFHVHGISGFANGHEGDALHWLDAPTGARTLGWNWGCSHSMSDLLRYSPAANAILSACVTDCFPGTSGTNFATNAIGGIYLERNAKVRDVDAGCNGSVAGELGGASPGAVGWKMVFNTHQNAATLGQSSYSTTTMNQDIGFTAIANNKTAGPIVWLTTTPANEANSSIARWQPMGDTAEQYVVGWSVSGATPTYRLARVTPAGVFLEGPTTITTAKWGERDDPFRTHTNGDIIWAWFESAGATSFKVARLRSGATCP